MVKTEFSPVPELIDRVVVKTSPKHLFSMIENEGFGLVFTKIGPINSGTGDFGQTNEQQRHLNE